MKVYRVLRPFPVWNQTIPAERTIEISEDIGKVLADCGVLMAEEDYQKQRTARKEEKAKRKAEKEPAIEIPPKDAPKPVRRVGR